MERCGNCGGYFHRLATHWSQRSSGACRLYNAQLLQTAAQENLGLLQGDLSTDTEIEEHDYLPEQHAESETGNKSPRAEASLLSVDEGSEDVHPTAGRILAKGSVAWESQLASEKDPTNPYHPFANETEWGVASYLVKASLSRSQLTDFFALPYVST
jgi:hypothetical protein